MTIFMKKLNNISRSQAVYRHSRISSDDLHPAHYAFALAVCQKPGRSQEELARELCLNKSTVTRALSCLEEREYIRRDSLPTDKRQFAVYPTDKMLAILPEIKRVSDEWMQLLSEGIDEEELNVFNSVLERMEKRAREIVAGQEEAK